MSAVTSHFQGDRAELISSPTGRVLWDERVRQTPDLIFLYTSGKKWTYSEFDEAKSRAATGLAKLGVGLATPVLVVLPTGTESLLVHIALTQLGAVVIPVQPDLAIGEIHYQVEHSEATLAIVADDVLCSTIAPHISQFSHLRHLITDGTSTHWSDFSVPVSTLTELCENISPEEVATVVVLHKTTTCSRLSIWLANGSPVGSCLGSSPRRWIRRHVWATVRSTRQSAISRFVRAQAWEDLS